MLEICQGHIEVIEGPGRNRRISEAATEILHRRIRERITRHRDQQTTFDIYSAVDGEGTTRQLAKAAVIYEREEKEAKDLIAASLGHEWAPPQQEDTRPQWLQDSSSFESQRAA